MGESTQIQVKEIAMLNRPQTPMGENPIPGLGAVARTLALAMVLLLTLALSLGAVTGCSSNGEEAEEEDSGGDATYRDISPDELAEMMEDKDFLLINTHIPYEGDIPKTDLSIPYDEASAHMDKLPEDKDAQIVVYCRSDRMSRIAAGVWAEAGYTNILNLDGGFVAWKEAGYEFSE